MSSNVLDFRHQSVIVHYYVANSAFYIIEVA